MKHLLTCFSQSNWAFNFFIGFATPFIEADIGFSYGYLFAACNFIAVLVVFFFLPETTGKSLEEIDTMVSPKAVHCGRRGLTKYSSY